MPFLQRRQATWYLRFRLVNVQPTLTSDRRPILTRVVSVFSSLYGSTATRSDWPKAGQKLFLGEAGVEATA
jgi:hypothetical protein